VRNTHTDDINKYKEKIAQLRLSLSKNNNIEKIRQDIDRRDREYQESLKNTQESLKERDNKIRQSISYIEKQLKKLSPRQSRSVGSTPSTRPKSKTPPNGHNVNTVKTPKSIEVSKVAPQKIRKVRIGSEGEVPAYLHGARNESNTEAARKSNKPAWNSGASKKASVQRQLSAPQFNWNNNPRKSLSTSSFTVGTPQTTPSLQARRRAGSPNKEPWR
jgi:hypothetical protein